MFAGHIGAALAVGRLEPRLNPGMLAFAALLLDVALWLFVLLGWETVTIPPNYGTTHQMVFVFPYSHGLLTAVAWSTLAGAAAYFWHPSAGGTKARAALCVAAAVFSHWLLDVLVHVPELPLTGPDSLKVGLSLWQITWAALALEAVITLAGLGLFLSGTKLPRGRKLWFTVLCLLVLVFTVIGMTLAPAPPSAKAVAGSSLATIVAVCALAGWLGKRHI